MLQSYGLMGGEHCRMSTNDVIDDVDDSVSESLVEVNDYGDNVNDVDDSSRKMLVEVIDFGDNISRDSWMEGIQKSSTSHLSNCTDISHESSIKEHSKNLKHFVTSMYVSALHQTGSGAQGKLLLPPIAKPIKQNSGTIVIICHANLPAAWITLFSKCGQAEKMRSRLVIHFFVMSSLVTKMNSYKNTTFSFFLYLVCH
jgi:hypothetical protein